MVISFKKNKLFATKKSDATFSLVMNIHCYSCTLISPFQKIELFTESRENYGFEEIIQRNIVQQRVKY